MSKQKVASGFNRTAAFYDFFASLLLGGKIHRSQTHFFHKLPKIKHALIVGGGTGKLIPALTRTGKVNHITYLDISEKMIQRAKKREAHNLPIEFICGTINDLPDYKLFDLVITPYILDCFPQKEMEATVTHLAKHQPEKGIWLFSDFQYSNQSGFWHWASKRIVHSLYFFFRICCGLQNKQLPTFQKAFRVSGYAKQQEAHYAKGMLQSIWWKKSATLSPTSQ